MTENIDNPYLTELTQKLRVDWAKKLTVKNPVAAVRDVEPLAVRVKSAAHVLAFGPLLAGHKTCNALMWDANAFSSHDAAFEAAALIYDVLAACMERLPQDVIDSIAIQSAMRRQRLLDRYPAEVSAVAESFISEEKHSAITLFAKVALVQGSSADVALRFDPKTGRLLCVLVPIACTLTALVTFLKSQIDEFMVELSRVDFMSTQLPYKNTLQTLILSSIASLTALISEDIDCLKQFCEQGN